MKTRNYYLTTLFALSMFLLGSCSEEVMQKEEEAPKLSSAEFLKQNMSIYDARVRSVDETSYVRELFLANFSDQKWDKTSIGFEGFLFEDNGTGNDLVANDGVYTSVEFFSHDSKVPYMKDRLVRSVLATPIVSPEFKKFESLQELSMSYDLNRIDKNGAKIAGPVATLECDVELCSDGCLADWVWDGFGCVCVSNCKATVGWN